MSGIVFRSYQEVKWEHSIARIQWFLIIFVADVTSEFGDFGAVFLLLECVPVNVLVVVVFGVLGQWYE